jgi:hypothetical protein
MIVLEGKNGMYEGQKIYPGSALYNTGAAASMKMNPATPLNFHTYLSRLMR